MNHEISLTVPDTGFEAKVVAIADELLNILKELSRENIQQINSRTISEKMLWNDSVKRLLANDGSNLDKDDIDMTESGNLPILLYLNLLRLRLRA